MRALTAAITSILILNLIPSAEAFWDTPAQHIYGQAALSLKQKGILHGYSDGSFKPTRGINRAEFLKIVISAWYSESEIASCTWNNHLWDVPRGAWYEPYVCIAVRDGIIKGYGDGTFRGNWAVNGAEAAKMVVIGMDIPFQEDPTVWYRGYTNVLRNSNAMPPTVTNPNKYLTRAEMAYLIDRVLQKKESNNQQRTQIAVTPPPPQPTSTTIDDVVLTKDIVYSTPAWSDPQLTSLDVYAPRGAQDHLGAWWRMDER